METLEGIAEDHETRISATESDVRGEDMKMIFFQYEQRKIN